MRFTGKSRSRKKRRLNNLPGASAILGYMAARYQDRQLLCADVLFQSPATDGSTVFSTHRDNRSEVEDAGITVVIKLTGGSSSVEVLGCLPTKYPAEAGSYVAFQSGSLHRSVPADAEHYKLVLFYSRTQVADSATEWALSDHTRVVVTVACARVSFVVC